MKDAEKINHLLKNKNRLKVLEALYKRHGEGRGLINEAVSQKCGFPNPSTSIRHLWLLVDAGLASKSEYKEYRLTELGVQVAKTFLKRK